MFVNAVIITCREKRPPCSSEGTDVGEQIALPLQTPAFGGRSAIRLLAWASAMLVVSYLVS